MDEQTLMVAELLQNMGDGWQTYNAFIDSLTPAQLTEPTDAAGWTAKDHMAHLMMWEESLLPLLDRQSRAEYFKIDPVVWDSDDWDTLNAVIQQRHKDMVLDEVRQKHQEIHDRLMTKIQALTDADLYRPLHEFQPESQYDLPIINLLMDDTYRHYDEHSDYIAKIVGKARE